MAYKFTNPRVWIGTNLPLSDYVRTVAIEEEAEQLDLGTFSNPRGIEWGRKSGSITLNGLWNEALAAAVSPYIGTSFAVKIQPNALTSSYLNGTVTAGVAPWTEFENDALGEFSWVLPLTSEITTS